MTPEERHGLHEVAGSGARERPESATRGRYVSDTTGAPPLPPPGGYRGARRAAPPASPAGRDAGDAPPPALSRDRAGGTSGGVWGWGALIVSVLFTVVLLGAMLAGATDVIYGITLVAVQLVVLGVIGAALATRRGRSLGVSALVIALLFNVPTVGAASAMLSAATGGYGAQKSPQQQREEAYPGIKGTPPEETLARTSLEDVRAQSTTMLADIRDRLTARFGYSWVAAEPETLRPERNGYGGESMLLRYVSDSWMTAEPITGDARKLEAMEVIDEVIAEHGMYGLFSLNDPASGLDPTVLEKFYGSADPRTQHTWEWFSDNSPEPLRFYAVIYDLSNDPSGELRAGREAQSARTGEPVAGLQISLIASELLSEADRAAFEQRLTDAPGR